MNLLLDSIIGLALLVALYLFYNWSQKKFWSMYIQDVKETNERKRKEIDKLTSEVWNIEQLGKLPSNEGEKHENKK